MKESKGLVRFAHKRVKTARWIPAVVGVALIFLLAGLPAHAQGEKRTVFAPDDFHWQASLRAGQTLEVINTNGEIGANRASGDAARITGVPRGSHENLFVEVVEYADGVTICAVYAKDKAPGRCHRGGVSSESSKWSLWHGDRAKI